MTKQSGRTWFRYVPAVRWLADYRVEWLASDAIAGATLAAYAIPVSLAYAGLAGLPPQAGIYGYLLGGLGYSLLGSSRQLAIGPTSAISLMIAGTVAAMADGDAQRYAQIASLAAGMVALLCLIAWLLRLSMLVRLISDSILVGFKAGAGLTIAMTQVPSLLGVAGGGHNFFERAALLAGQLGEINYLVFALGIVAILLLVLDMPLLLQNAQQRAHRGVARCLRQFRLNFGHAGGPALIEDVENLPLAAAEVRRSGLTRHAKNLALPFRAVKHFC